MATYNFVTVKNEKGEDITVTIGFEHEKNELRCLAVMHDPDEYQWCVIRSGKLTQMSSDGEYAVAYPFATKLKPWSVIIWRETAVSEDVEYNGTTIPIEQVVAKLEELTQKAEEAAKEAGRSMRTPEGGSDAFVPPVDVRAGKILGFDDEGNPAVGTQVSQVAALYQQVSACEELVKEAKLYAESSASSAALSNTYRAAASTYADDAGESASKAQDYYNKTVATFQKVDTAVASGLEEITATANEAQETITTTLGESVELCRQYKEAAEGSADNAANSEALSQEAADKCEALLVQAVKGWTTKIVSSLPSNPDVNTVYFVGNDDDGYAMQIYSDGAWVVIGNTSFAENRPMTVSSYGLGKLSTGVSQSLSNAGMIGVNSAGQLLAMKASTGYFGTVRLSTDAEINPDSDDYKERGGEIGLTSGGQAYTVTGTIDRFGALRLGSKYQPTNASPYVVGIGASTNTGKVGQLAFNLKTTQSDGTAGCLKYAIKDGTSGDTLQYEMYVEDASASQKGVCRLVSSLEGYTDEEIEEMRDNVAASVGLVSDGVESYVRSYVTEGRISEFFDNWAEGQDLAAQIWNDDEKRGALETYLSDYIDGSSVLLAKVEDTTSGIVTSKLTDEYILSLINDTVLKVCEDAVEEHWDEDLETAIAEAAETQARKYTESRVVAYLQNPDNVSVITSAVTEGAIDEIVESAQEQAAETTAEYVQNVFDSKQQINLDDEMVYFSDYVKQQSEGAVDALATELETRMSTLESSVSTLSSVSKRFAGGTWRQATFGEKYDISFCDLIVLKGNMGGNRTDVIRVEELYALVESGVYSGTVSFVTNAVMSHGKKGTWAAQNVVSINIKNFPEVSFSWSREGQQDFPNVPTVRLHYPVGV